MSVNGSEFLPRFRSEFGITANEKVLENILCIDRTISYYTLVEHGKEYDFLFDMSMIPAPLDATTMSQESRLVLTNTIIGLMKDFSSETMSDHIVAIITYLKGNDIEQKAKEWGLTIRESRTGIEPTDAHKHAIRLDRARRAWFYFYQQYVVIWRIGQVSQDIMKDLDFPGKSRIKDFLKYNEPLERHDYMTVMQNEPLEWSHREPKVYVFLLELI